MTLIKLIVTYLFDFVRANLSVAVQVLSPNMRMESKTIEMETRVESPAEVLALSNLITFTPGTLALDVEPGRKLTVHVLSNSESAEQLIKERLEEPLLKITRGRK